LLSRCYRARYRRDLYSANVHALITRIFSCPCLWIRFAVLKFASLRLCSDFRGRVTMQMRMEYKFRLFSSGKTR